MHFQNGDLKIKMRVSRRNIIIFIVFLFSKDSFSMETSMETMKDVKNRTVLYGGSKPRDLYKATDGDIYTYVQTTEGMNVAFSVVFERRKNFSCFYMRARGGIYDIYISQNDTDIGDVCRSFSLMENDLSPHMVRFCCDKNMDGEMLTVMKIGYGFLRLFEINVEDCVEHMDSLKTCGGCNGSCSLCLQVDSECISCKDTPNGIGCCSRNCASENCDTKGACAKCMPGYYGPYCRQCPSGQYGENCAHRCPKGCRFKCKPKDGSCSGCEKGFYNLPSCDLRCNSAFPYCQSCTNSSYCEQCNMGRYGATCSHKCSDQCEICVNLTSCMQCRSGYYGPLCSSECPVQCSSCKNDTFCDNCPPDRKGPTCSCSKHCMGDCSEDGTCPGNCTNGWFGSDCLQKCSDRCKHCIASADNCTECVYGIPPRCISSFFISEETMTMMMVGGGGILLMVLIFICIVVIIKRLCISPRIHSYGFIETQDVQMEPMEQSNPYSNPEQEDEYINTANRLSVDEFILGVQHKKLNYGFRREFKKISYTMNDSFDAAIDPKNKSRNRYKNIYPYDFSRVVLDTSDVAGSSDYINACFVHGFERQRFFIAAQGPFTEETVMDFWRMVWQMGSVKIVMLTNLTEAGKMKCVKYWPNTQTLLGPYQIRMERQNTSRRYILRHIKIKKGIEERQVTQYQYTDWYTTQVPSSVDSVLMFRNLIMSDVTENDGPIIVHCSAGTGRTGTFIALDYLLREGLETGTVDVVAFIRALRQQRAYAVQSTDEYIFLHDALVEGFSSAYENGTFEIEGSF
uniref:protein-tyrosine-phosphatase n=1 Tax=Crassostrea virginica TaxID=6565 RepID=A0A8B8CDG4_CRAVI|nr:uncharacterized protein LOC111118170 [Crassostrea virginica]